MDIPKCITSQKAEQVICMMASFNNMMQSPIYKSFNAFKLDCKTAWLNLPSTQGRKEEVKRRMLNELIGPRGISASLALPLCRELGLKAESIKKGECWQIKYGMIVIETETFFHMIAINNGFVIDSIGCNIYEWTGEIYGYGKTLYPSYGIEINPKLK